MRPAGTPPRSPRRGPTGRDALCGAVAAAAAAVASARSSVNARNLIALVVAVQSHRYRRVVIEWCNDSSSGGGGTRRAVILC